MDTLVSDTSTGWMLVLFLVMENMGGETGFEGRERMTSPLDVG